jgi:hypothetical protein
LNDEVWLVLNKRQVVKMTKTKPALARDQIKIRVRVTVEDSIFTEIELERSIEITQANQESSISITQLEKDIKRLKDGGSK